MLHLYLQGVDKSMISPSMPYTLCGYLSTLTPYPPLPPPHPTPIHTHSPPRVQEEVLVHCRPYDELELPDGPGSGVHTRQEDAA